MTLNDFIQSMRNHGFTDTDTATLTELLNDAYEDVWGREAWPFRDAQTTETTTAGNATLTLPTDFGKATSLVIDDLAVNLIPKRHDELLHQFSGDLTYSGLPIYYYFVGNVLKLYPVPDAVYTVTIAYVKKFTPLTSGTDEPALPSNHRIVLLGALASAYDMEDDTDLAVRFEGRFENRMQTVREEWWMQQYDKPDLVHDIYLFEDIYYD